LVVSDLAPYVESKAWLSDFGDLLVSIDEKRLEDGLPRHIYMALYKDGMKIDFQIYPTALFQRYKEAPALPNRLDVGYRILLDKDGLALDLAPFTNTAHIPARPTEQEYLALAQEFWWETTYVAKNLWRDELMFARYILDVDIKFDLLRRMLEWYLELDHHWMLRPGIHGKGLKKLLAPEIWNELEATFVGPRSEENWEALFKTMALFRKIAVRVAEGLGYDYPAELDARVTNYLQKVQKLDKDAEKFA
jgi:aminoglycoside 6-adenylyltransferase